ncbi:hypothetical protein A2G06_07075 [Geobacter anodireducens]|nr:hypothetical protein A2G06_07075 [Geobacter anodireducens]
MRQCTHQQIDTFDRLQVCGNGDPHIRLAFTEERWQHRWRHRQIKTVADHGNLAGRHLFMRRHMVLYRVCIYGNAVAQPKNMGTYLPEQSVIRGFITSQAQIAPADNQSMLLPAQDFSKKTGKHRVFEKSLDDIDIPFLEKPQIASQHKRETGSQKPSISKGYHITGQTISGQPGRIVQADHERVHGEAFQDVEQLLLGSGLVGTDGVNEICDADGTCHREKYPCLKP